jgi:hypothetical protein
MYQRSSRRPLTILVALSLAINVLLAVAYLEQRGRVNETARKVQRLEVSKADTNDLIRWTNRVRTCMNELAADGVDQPKKCATAEPTP